MICALASAPMCSARADALTAALHADYSLKAASAFCARMSADQAEAVLFEGDLEHEDAVLRAASYRLFRHTDHREACARFGRENTARMAAAGRVRPSYRTQNGSVS